MIPTPCSFNNFSRGVSYRGLAAPEPPPVGLSPGGSNRKLQTNEDHLSAQLDEIWMMVLSTASLMNFLNIFFQNQKTLWNRSNRKLQTNEDHLSAQLDEIWMMVLSTASLMYVLSICFQNQKTSWNRSNRKLQTWELVVSTRNFTPWIMVQLKTWFKAFQYPWYRPSDHQKNKKTKNMKNLKNEKWKN